MLRIFFLLILVCSCSGQKEAQNKFTSKNFSTSCRNLNLEKDFLEKENLIESFKCFKWNQKYPKLFTAINSIPTESFNDSVYFLNESLFKNKEIRNKHFQFLENDIAGEDLSSTYKLLTLLLKTGDLLTFLKIQNEKPVSPSLPSQDLIQSLLTLFTKISPLTDLARIKARENSDLAELPVSLAQNLNEENFLLSSRSVLLNHEFFHLAFLSGDSSTFEDLVAFPKKSKRLDDAFGYLLEKVESREILCDDVIVDPYLELKNELLKLKDISYVDSYEFAVNLSLKLSFLDSVCSQDEMANSSKVIIAELLPFFASEVNFSFLKGVSNAAYESNDYKFPLNLIQSDSFNLFSNASADQEVLDFFYLVGRDIALNFQSFDDLINDLYDSEPFFKQFSNEELTYIAQSVSDVMRNDLNLLNAVITMDKINSSFNVLSNLYRLKPKLSSLVLTLSTLSKPDIISELDDFLGKDNLLKLLSIIQKNRSNTLSSSYETVNTKPLVVKDVLNLPAKKCLEGFSNIVRSGGNHLDMITNIDSSCLDLVKSEDSFAVNIYKDLVSVQLYFSVHYDLDFSVKNGVLSKELIDNYISIILNLTKSTTFLSDLESFRKSYLLNRVEVSSQLNDFLTSLKGFVDFVDVKQFLNTLGQIDSATINRNANSLVQSFTKDDIALSELQFNSCQGQKQLDYTNTCLLSTSKTFEHYKQIKNILVADGTSTPFSRDLLSILYGDLITIGEKPKKMLNYEIGLKSFLKFFYDTTLKSTRSKILYTFEDFAQENIKLTLAERLEVTIRDISFLNNYYGAFFMNKVGNSKNYFQKVKSLKSNVGVLRSTGGAFRKIGIFPRSTISRFRNIYRTYDSLLDVTAIKTPRGNTNHSPFLHSLLYLTFKNSDAFSQRIVALKKPNPYQTSGHNGFLITNLTKYSAISQIGDLLHNIFPTYESFEDNMKLNWLSENLERIIPKQKLLTLIEKSFHDDLLYDIFPKVTDVEAYLPLLLKSLIEISGDIQTDLYFYDNLEILLDSLSEAQDRTSISNTVSRLSLSLMKTLVNLGDQDRREFLVLVAKILNEVKIQNKIESRFFTSWSNILEKFNSSDIDYSSLGSIFRSKELNLNQLINFMTNCAKNDDRFKYCTSIAKYIYRDDSNALVQSVDELMTSKYDSLVQFVYEIQNSLKMLDASK